MVMIFDLHPLSHYNSITEPRARFLLSLLEGLTMNFPSHFILSLSLIDVYRDTATRDKLIFPSAIMWIIRHLSIPYLESSHFTVMGAISTASVHHDTLTTKLHQVNTRVSRIDLTKLVIYLYYHAFFMLN